MIITGAHGKKVSSQFGEDGIIEVILNEIGTRDKTFIEIGTGDGTECNCVALRKNQGWYGVLIDCAHENEDVIKRRITAGNVQRTLMEVGAPLNPDVFSLDIDGIDWYVLRCLGPYLPSRLIVCEFNGHFGADECKAVPYDPGFQFCGTRFYGASQRAMHRLGNELGFSMVFSNAVNMFLVRREFAHHFERADNVELLYSGPWSHPPDPRMDQMIDPFTVPLATLLAG